MNFAITNIIIISHDIIMLNNLNGIVAFKYKVLPLFPFGDRGNT